VGTTLFVLPNLLALIQHKLPNSRVLYHVMPQGMVNLALSLWMGGVSLVALTSMFGPTADLAKIGFVLLPIPTVIISVLRLFGRSGHEGEARFYQNPKWVWVYRVGGLVVVYLTAIMMHLISGPVLY